MPDATNDAAMDKVLSHLDSMSKRMDSMEANYADGMKRVDSVCAKMDADKKEKEDKDKEKAKCDAEAAVQADADAKAAEKLRADEAARVQADADAKEAQAKLDAAANVSNANIIARLDEMSRKMTPKPETEVALFTAAQVQADAVYQAFNDASAPRWIDGETLPAYVRRLATKYKEHSRTFKDVDLAAINDAVALDAVVKVIYTDALAVSSSPSLIPAGQLRERITSDRTGRRISRFEGDTESCWGPFKQPVRGVTGMSPHRAH